MKRVNFHFCLILLLSIWCLGSLKANAATFAVNNIGDTADANAGNGACDDGAGQCTLRAAIQEANALTGADTISFSGLPSGVQTISPVQPLPAITTSLTIDGSTAPGFAGNPVVVLSGASAVNLANGLQISGALDCVIKSLVIHGFSTGSGIRIDNGSGRNRVTGCYIGTNVAGMASVPNQTGVTIQGSSGTNIGGTTTADRNIISGNSSSGVVIINSSTANADNNNVLGNFIGTDVNGQGDLGNASHGVQLVGGATRGATGNVIGGSGATFRNIISGNDSNGVDLSGADSNFVSGNYIGLDSTGSVAIANGANGIVVGSGSNGNTIGGNTAAEGNVISGNTSAGIWILGSTSVVNLVRLNKIGTDAAGTGARPNGTQGIFINNGAQDNVIGGGGLANTIAFNGQQGILIANNSPDNRIQFNSIFSNAKLGIDLSGGTEDANGVTANDTGDADTGANQLQNYPVLTSAVETSGNTVVNGSLNSLPNQMFWIDVYRSASVDPSGFGEGQTHIGNSIVTTDATGNVTFQITATGITSAGQYITATATGLGAIDDTSEFSQAIQAQGNPILVTTTADNGNNTTPTAGSLRAAMINANNTAGADNIIFNIPATAAVGGVFTITPTSQLPALTDNGTTIDGATQTAFTGDTNTGGPEIVINGASAGTSSSGIIINAANCTISNLVINRFNGFDQAGIVIGNPTATSNTIRGCYIGTNATGTSAVDNHRGIKIGNRASGNVIGGSSAADRNVISGNSSVGVRLDGNGTSNNIIRGNYIGTDAAASGRIPNEDGVALFNDANNNVIGGTNVNARNILSGNGRYGVLIATSGNSVQGNYIGTDAGGTSSVFNNVSGVNISGSNSSNNVIGGTANGAGNLISGNTRVGVTIESPNATGNRVEGNLIGTNAAGTGAVPNANGVALSTGANNNTIGGTSVAARNIISGSTEDGIVMESTGTTGNLIQGNYIGTNAAGTAALRNQQNGIRIHNGAEGNTVGGSVAGAGNVISGNTKGTTFTELAAGVRIDGVNNNFVRGNFIGLNAAGTTSIPNEIGVYLISANNNTIGGTTAAERNVISGINSLVGGFPDGILLEGSNNNTIQGNYVGLNPAGTAAIKNTNNGINLRAGSSGNTIGGTASGAGNVVTGNPNRGIVISGAGTNNNLVQGNIIGLNATGTAVVPYDNTTGSPGNGVAIDVTMGAKNNVIGGTVTGARNIISGNGTGVSITTNVGTIITSDNLVQGNYIGTDITGTIALSANSPSQQGLSIAFDAENNTVGGTTAAARNIISGNNTAVFLFGVKNNLVQGNYIGTDPTGMTAVPNSSVGVLASGGSNNTIGGTVSGAGNVISGNANGGVLLNGSTGFVVQGNLIGTNASGSGPIPNANGVSLESGAKNNSIGGITAGEANTIAFNTDDGVVIEGSTTTGNLVRGNVIMANGGLGINLQPTGEAIKTVTPNDAGDADTGPNGLQNFPVITNVAASGGNVNISGTLNSTPSTTFGLDFYRNSAADASGFGEGAVYAGSSNVTTDANGNATFTFSIADPSGTIQSQFLSATATNGTTGDTSEFSQAQGLTPSLALSITPATFSEVAGANAATGTITRSGSTITPLTVNLSSSNTGKATVPASVTIPAGQASVTFPISAVDNQVVDGPQIVTITASATGFISGTATVTVTNNDTVGVIVTPTTGLVTTEAGGTATFTVRLNSQPTANVTINLSSSKTTEGMVAPAALTFTSANFATPQTVTVIGVDDAVADGDQSYTIALSVASSDPLYNNLPNVPAVSVVNRDNDVATLTLSANPTSFVEGAGTAVTLTRNTPTTVALTVNLSSSDSSTLPVPSTVTIPAGTATATFNIASVDDAVVNGSRVVTISAGLAGFGSGSAAVTITDNDVVTGPTPVPTPEPSLSVTLNPATISEGAGVSAAKGTVTRNNAATTAPLTVNLSSSNPRAARPAIASVTIPAGVTSATFAIDAVDDTLDENTEAVTFTASASGFTPGSAVLTVNDNDAPTLTLTVTPQRFSEAGGATVAQGRVTRNTATTSALTVTLTSSNTAAAIVPTRVTIPAGATSATFAIRAVSDNRPNGPRRIIVTARALNFATATAQATVLDADAASVLSIRGRITVATSSVLRADGPGIAGVTVTLKRGTVMVDEVQTDAAGNYNFTRLTEGTYTISVRKDNYTFTPLQQTVMINVKVREAKADFVGTPRPSITGRVTRRLSDGTVQAMAGVTLRIYGPQGILNARTNSNGQYTLTGLGLSTWTVTPALRGSFFTPSTRRVAITPVSPVVTGLDFMLVGTDTTLPTVTVLNPRAGSYTAATQPKQATGSAADNRGGSGIAVVTGAVLRYASATATTPTGFWSWRTNSFITADDATRVERLAGGTTSWTLNGLPVLPAGFYSIRATAIDGAGNNKQSTTVRYRVTAARADVPTVEPTPSASTVKLSTATAQASSSSITLRFGGALEGESAADAAHYTVKVNGQVVPVESAAYNASTRSVILGLVEGALQPGDAVTVQWSDVLDAQGNLASGQVGPLSVR